MNARGELAFCFKNIDQNYIPFGFQLNNLKDNQIFEYNPKAEHIMETLVQYLKSVSGAALIIDYGYLKGQGDTLQGVVQHKYASVLDNPGEVDLTSHVDFGRLQKITDDKGHLMTQRDFLFKYGLLHLAQKYGQKSNTEKRDQIEKQVYKLTSSMEMGTLFKVLEVGFVSSESKFYD